MEDQGPLCMSCADLAHLIFLPSGDAALTRRARKLICGVPLSVGGRGKPPAAVAAPRRTDELG